MGEQLNSCIETIITNYERLIKLSHKERAYLVAIDTVGLSAVIKEKEIYLNAIINCLNQIKAINARKSQLLKYKSKIIQLSNKFLYENSINAKITQQHLVFSSSMLNLYANFMQIDQTYNNKACLPHKSNFNRIV